MQENTGEVMQSSSKLSIPSGISPVQYHMCFMTLNTGTVFNHFLHTNTNPRLQEAMNELIQVKVGDAKAQKVVNQITTHFVLEATIITGKHASWARPRRSGDDYGDCFDGMDYYDGCPDG